MKRWLYFLAGLVAVGGVVLVGKSRGQLSTTPKAPAPLVEARPRPQPQVDVGPGEGGAKLRMPGMDEPARQPQQTPLAPQPSQQMPAFVQPLAVVRGANPAPSTAPKQRVAQPKAPRERYLPYKDIEITQNHGHYAIFVMGYSDVKEKEAPDGRKKSAPEMAARFVREIQTNPQYAEIKQRACVFHYGAEEKQREYERVEKIKQERVEQLRQLNQPTEGILMPTIRTVRIDEQTAVLLGGFKTREEAERALAKIKKLPQPNPKQVDMDVTYLGELQRDQKGQVQIDGAIRGYHGYAYVNPFPRAFVTRNPALQHDSSGGIPPEDVEFLKRINSGEPLSLFNCNHKYTLMVKQFSTQFKVVDAEEAQRFLASLSRLVLMKRGDWQDNAAHNAHNLAEALRKSGLSETYVLHGRNGSFVTVGGFDDLNDQRLVAAQQFLANRFRADDYRPLDMMPTPTPMLVPR